MPEPEEYHNSQAALLNAGGISRTVLQEQSHPKLIDEEAHQKLHVFLSRAFVHG